MSDLEVKEGSESISLEATLRNPFVPQTELLNNVSIKGPSGAAVFRVGPCLRIISRVRKYTVETQGTRLGLLIYIHRISNSVFDDSVHNLMVFTYINALSIYIG